jgi:myo-inositol-1(or 4)-monophosphatase
MTGAGAEPLPEDVELADIEMSALAFARAAGEAIIASHGEALTVEYKSEGKGDAEPTDPVSQIDRAIEAMIREQLAKEWPGHGIIGEEIDEQPDVNAEYTWAIDPVDGTSNFINGFPLYSASIGVLHRGRPVVGATWVSASTQLTPGVIHGRAGHGLHFEGEAMTAADPDKRIRRPLAAAPGGSPGRTDKWDNRVTGSAALECAYTASGIFTLCSFHGLRIWDVASGVALAQAAGLDVRTRRDGQWIAFDRFIAPATVKEDRGPTLRDWSEPLLIGRADSVSYHLLRRKQPGIVASIVRRMRRR